MDEAPNGSGLDKSGHTTGRKSAPITRVEVITRGERRRAWTLEQKREIVTESLGPELTATEVARKYGIRTGQLYTWRQRLLAGPNAVIRRAEPRFAEVELTPALSAPEPASPAPGRATAAVPSSRPEGLIEIVLPGGALVRVDTHVDGRALRRVLGALAGG
jgi:transposase